MRRWASGLAFALMSTACALLHSQAVVPASGPAIVSADSVWQFVRERPSGLSGPDLPPNAALVALNKAAYDRITQGAPVGSATISEVILAMPLPSRTFTRFRIAESSMLSPALAAAYPEIRTFVGQGVDDRSATSRFGWTEKGFHALLLTLDGDVYIDPYMPGNTEFYVTMRKRQ